MCIEEKFTTIVSTMQDYSQPNDSTSVDDYQPPQPKTPPSTDKTVGSPVVQNQSLETQNIFDLLGVSDGKEEEKEAFLNELQEVIWEDFVENDVELLLTSDQHSELKEIQKEGKTPEVQEKMLVFLEKLVPDLEDMMMDKAIELKEDMVLERISGMKEFYSSNSQALEQLSDAEGMISENKWADAGKLLNNIK